MAYTSAMFGSDRSNQCYEMDNILLMIRINHKTILLKVRLSVLFKKLFQIILLFESILWAINPLENPTNSLVSYLLRFIGVDLTKQKFHEITSKSIF